MKKPKKGTLLEKVTLVIEAPLLSKETLIINDRLKVNSKSGEEK